MISTVQMQRLKEIAEWQDFKGLFRPPKGRSNSTMEATDVELVMMGLCFFELGRWGTVKLTEAGRKAIA